MAQSTCSALVYHRTIPVTSVQQLQHWQSWWDWDPFAETMLVQDNAEGAYVVVINNSRWDLNLLLWDKPGFSAQPCVVPIGPSGSVAMDFPVVGYQLWQSRWDALARYTPPPGWWGGGGEQQWAYNPRQPFNQHPVYEGPGSIPQNGLDGYVTVMVYDRQVPVHVQSGERRRGPLTQRIVQDLTIGNSDTNVALWPYGYVTLQRLVAGRINYYWDGSGVQNGVCRLDLKWHYGPNFTSAQGPSWYLTPGVGEIRLDPDLDFPPGLSNPSFDAVWDAMWSDVAQAYETFMVLSVDQPTSVRVSVQIVTETWIR